MDRSRDILGLASSLASPVLAFLADGIRHAHQLAPAKWGVSYPVPGVRFNVGFCNVLVADEVFVLFDRDRLPAKVSKAIRLDRKAKYRNAPGCFGARVSPGTSSQLRAELESLRPAFLAAIDSSSKRQFNRGSKAGHRDWLVSEISTMLGDPLPRPRHDSSESDHAAFGAAGRHQPDEIADAVVWLLSEEAR